MCGIFGTWSERDEVARLSAALSHRGPDDEGRFDHGRLHLGNRRLAIRDLSARGRQPMVSDDGALVLTFNGEIYNHADLRRRLEARGERFETTTDTEVVLAAFRAWGTGAVSELAGMFALALWSERDDALCLVRDPTGVKPLYYVELDDGSFAFASEMQALLALAGVRREIDAERLWQFLEFGYGWNAERTILRGVRQVPPGHLVRICAGRVVEQSAWYQAPAPELAIDTPAELDRRADELYEVLVEVVRQQLDADVPIGLLLSGGLDSSILAAIANSVLKAGVPAYTLGFAGASQEDLVSARMVAARLGCPHRELLLDGEAVARELRENAARFDDLFWDPGLVSSLALFRWLRSAGNVVALVGEGADEIFGGYSSFARLGGAEQAALPPLLGFYRFFRHYAGRASGRSLEKTLVDVRAIHARNGNRWYDTIRDFELRCQLPNNLNAKLDRASMASGVEARVPYQDPRVLASALKIRTDAEHGGNKQILRHMAARHDLLPEAILTRPKLAMMMPREWIFTDSEVRSLAQRTLAEGSWTERLGLERELSDVHLAWRVVILELWSRALGIADAPVVSA